MAIATYATEVAWTGQLTGVLIVGTSVVGGTDVVAGDFGYNAFDDVSGDAEVLTWRRGRSSDFSAVDQGKATILLRDQSGKYNPENASSTLYPNVVPMRPVRIRATYAGTTYNCFYGFISRIEFDPNERQSVVEAVDFFEWLDLYKPTIATQTSQRIDQLIGTILDSTGLTDPNFRSLEISTHTVPSWSADGSTSALTLISQLLAVDLGTVYVDGAGRLVYKNVNTRYQNGTAAATFDDATIGSLKTYSEARTILNGQRATRTGGSQQTATDTTSRKQYGYRDGGDVESAYFATDSQALAFCQFRVAVDKDPRPPGRSIQISNGTANNLTQELTRELLDLVTVSEPIGGTSFLARIQAMEHRVEKGSHKAIYTVQKATLSVLTVGVSTVGSADVVGY